MTPMSLGVLIAISLIAYAIGTIAFILLGGTYMTVMFGVVVGLVGGLVASDYIDRL